MLNRRQLIGGSISGFFAFAARNQLDSFVSRAMDPNGKPGKARRCLILWMEGGPSQLDTFDPKPGTSTGGPLRAISTSAPGVEISETLPEVARQMHNLSVIRNLTSREGEHVRASYYMHTGFKFVPSFPRPALGSVIAHEMPDCDFPKYVSLGSPGYGPAYMGPENSPFSIEDPAQARDLIRAIRRRSDRLSLLRQLDSSFNRAHDDPRIQQRGAILEKIERMATTDFANCLDISRLKQSDLRRYGDTEFGRRCLVARQLLEMGVSFVEVQQSGWDTHANNFANVRRLCSQIDRPFAALVEDMKSSGMYNDTLIVWMGEFGRTPAINAQQGRDHFPAVTPVVLGGGPFRSGLAVGKTDGSGRQIDGDAYQVADLFATLLHAFGIEADREFTTDFDSPTTATEQGKLIRELV